MVQTGVPKADYSSPRQTMTDQSILKSAVLPASPMPLLKWFLLLWCKSFPFLTQIMFMLAPSALVQPEWITSFNFSVWTLAVRRRYGPVCSNINTLFHNLFTFTTTPTLWLLSRNFQTKSLMNHFNHHDSSLNYKSTRNHFTIVVPWFQLLCYSSFYSAALKNWISDCNFAE